MTIYPTIKHNLLLCFLLIMSAAQAVELKDVPNSVGFVNDFANILTPEQTEKLNTALKYYFDSTSNQIAVVTEQSLDGRDVFDRSMDFARGWNVGTKNKNNGVVLYIAVKERKLFILAADKTQGALPDGLAGSIIRNEITPSFKTGDYNAGINKGVLAIISALEGEFVNDGELSTPVHIPIFLIIFIILLLFIIISSKNNGKGGGYYRGGTYWFPVDNFPRGGGRGWTGGGGGGGSSWGGFGGGGGFNGGGAGGSW